MKKMFKKIGEAVDKAEDAVFTEDGERDIDLSVPGVTRDKTKIKKHKRGIYSMQRTRINYIPIILVIIVIIGIIAVGGFGGGERSNEPILIDERTVTTP